MALKGRYVRYFEGRDKEKIQGMSMRGFDLWIERLVAWVQPRHHYAYLAHSKRCETNGHFR